MKKIKYIFSITLALVAALFFQSCNDSESAGSPINTFHGEEAIEQLDFSIGTAFTMIGVECQSDWTASSDADWCKISNHAGYGYADKKSYVKVSVEKNPGDERTALITFSSGTNQKVLKVRQRGAGADPGDTFETAFEFVENITIGYNLGNTLDCDPDLANSSWFNPTSDLDWETVWGQPKTTQDIIDSIANKGFDVIRVPVTWFPHMDAEGNVNEVWMNRVQEVVDMVINAGCYCILNIQHDSGARNGRSDGAGWLIADMDEYPTSSVKFQHLWKQIATRFKDYDHHLLFEAFNEILDKNDTWGDPSDASAYEAITKLEQDFVNAVRSTGGNNEFRNLVCNTYSAGHTPAKLAGFQVPLDVHANHLLASIHNYDPYNFCNDNKDWNIFVWDNSCEEELAAIGERINRRFNELGIPYIYGEFGAIDENKDMGERIKYAKYTTAMYKRYETKGLWWMGLFDRKNLKWYEDEIVEALINGSAK